MSGGAENKLPTASLAAPKLLPNVLSILFNLIETFTSLIAFSGEVNFCVGKIFSSTAGIEVGLQVSCLLSAFWSDKVLSLLVFICQNNIPVFNLFLKCHSLKYTITNQLFKQQLKILASFTAFKMLRLFGNKRKNQLNKL